MRDAVGGAFMIKLLLVFLAVYTIFIAIAINYAKAFRVKNKILDIIEQNEGMNFIDTSDGSVRDQLDTYMNNINYNVINGYSDIKARVEDKCSGYGFIDTNRGYCINEVTNEVTSSSNVSTADASYYQVRTFVTISIPLVRNLSFTIPISGETRKIEKVE